MERLRLATLSFVLLFASGLAFAQASDDPSSAIVSRDASFWRAFNACDQPAFPDFFTEDVEFYHDKGGPTLGRDALLASLKNGVCGPDQARIRREAVAGSVRVFPLRKDGVVYGAILDGEHLFYLAQKDGSEHLDGRARFTHLWLLKDGAWLMCRILSYDHGPATRGETQPRRQVR